MMEPQLQAEPVEGVVLGHVGEDDAVTFGEALDHLDELHGPAAELHRRSSCLAGSARS